MTAMEKILSPSQLKAAGEAWADTLFKACGAAPGDRLDDAQTAALTAFVLGQMCAKHRPQEPAKPLRYPLFPFVPTKKRGPPARAAPVAKRFKFAEPVENVKPAPVSKNPKIKKAPVRREEEAVVTVRPLPGRFREAMMGMGVIREDTITFVVQRVLTGTDVGKTQNRLQIPVKKIKASGFLTAEEKGRVGSAEGMVVPVMEPSGDVCELRLRLWHMNKNKYYALVNKHQRPDDSPHKWHGLVTRNGIRQDDTLQVWSFRVGSESKLCLALVKL